MRFETMCFELLCEVIDEVRSVARPRRIRGDDDGSLTVACLNKLCQGLRVAAQVHDVEFDA